MPESIDLAADADSTPNSRRGSEPLTDAALAQLNIAIDTVSEARLREILTGVVDRVPAVARAVFSELVRTVADDSDQESDQEGVREYAPRWEVCVNCDEEYDASKERDEGECVYHAAQIEYDPRDFEEWHFYEPVDTPDNRSRYPGKFSWPCCGGDGTVEWCEEGVHEPGGMSKKQPRH
ncbi:hypothetical protein BOTBODRAFT_55512 [Botryobasidium botryosum FD-172 SS1]|uniref:Uncharacterized protein n=1 Tax=Botryobasidium botryosum (strain FD-172 SS1) TaxID=930990 RepID=A0A067MS39_BOTB1|nr:hypothetical protein BOTBODRAFT_55512 [Botryobasidium botryosum FD-172 SS1]